MHAHDFYEQHWIDCDEVVGGDRLQPASVPPLRPEHGLPNPVLVVRGRFQAGAVHRRVLQGSTLPFDEVHLRGLVPRAEDYLLLGVGLQLQADVAEPVHHHTHGRVQVVEKGVLDQESRVQLVCQLALQGHRQLRQGGLQAVCLHELALLGSLVLQVLEDSIREVGGDLALPEVAPEKPELLHLLRLHVAEACHRACDARDDGGEGDQGQEEDNDRECALENVAGADVHGSGCKLCERPVHASRVLVHNALVLNVTHLDPVPDASLHADPANQVPDARDHMVEDQDSKQQLCQVDADEGVLALDHVIQEVDDPLQLQQAQQTQDADGARSLEEFDHLARLPLVLAGSRAEDRHKPLRHDNDCIGNEPRHHVVPQDLAVV
mmetsp:Transcript_79876/g.178719  ORF Transcript_79876/g.178719 Transcript_79876/m.178719 type:complete len:379 (-) Transcript_79876:321-1457(-)